MDRESAQHYRKIGIEGIVSVLFCQKDGRPDHIVLVRNPGVDPATRYYDSTNGEASSQASKSASLLGTSASLLGTRALLVVTMLAIEV